MEIGSGTGHKDHNVSDTGTPPGRFEGHSRDRDDFEPLGDGTWIVPGTDGSAIRSVFMAVRWWPQLNCGP
jgi:hypothetical protein